MQEKASHNLVTWLIFTSKASIGEALAQQFAQQGESVITVEPGMHFTVYDDQKIVLNPANTQDYDELLKHLNKSDKRLYKVVHAWSLTEDTRALSRDRKGCTETWFLQLTISSSSNGPSPHGA